MFLIFGTRFFTWGSQRTSSQMRCQTCGALTNFVVKKGMRFLTFFFLIPTIPLSGVKHITQCPNCGTRYQTA